MIVLRRFPAVLPLLGLATGQFVPPPTDLEKAKGYAGVDVRYKKVPAGICELDPDVKSFSGYADVGVDQHIFWWFFETRNGNPEDAPLTIWINGGPGSASMIALFQENGPCFIDQDYQVVYNPYSWTNVTNMLYIDQPAQTGHSYSAAVPGFIGSSGEIVTLPSFECPRFAQGLNCGTYSYPNASETASSTEGAAPAFWKTLQGFMGAFPQYARNKVFLTTESYGGHYGPVFSNYFEKQNNANISNAQNIQLAGVLIGNGWFDPLIQYQAYYNYTVNPGSPYDIQFFNESIQELMYGNLYVRGNCVDRIKDCYALGTDEICSNADQFCADEVENLFDIYSGRDEYDSRELMPDPFPPEYYVTYLNTPAVQQAIGAFVNFTEMSHTVSNAFGSTGDDSRKVGVIEDLKGLLDLGVAVILYSGDADYNCNYLGGEVVAHEVGAAGFDNAGYSIIRTPDHIPHGEVKQSGNFAFVRVYESGHEVPFYQPLLSLEMLRRVIAGKDIATGSQNVTPNYTSPGTQLSTYREGNSTVQIAPLPPNSTYNVALGAPNPVPSHVTLIKTWGSITSRENLGRRGPGPAAKRRAMRRQRLRH